MSVEVAEHVPKERSDAFINNLLKHAKKNVLFTAAPPGQHGTGHVNCQPKEFWFEKFSSRGWKPDEEYTNKIKELWFSLRTPPYIIRNLNMFIPIL
jgi:cyclopropane fatty-acyl-phospholipid synthase-like methyltransferase